MVIAALARERPDLAYNCNGRVTTACDLALAALALTADGFGCVPFEVAAFMHHVGQRFGSGGWLCLARRWAGHMAMPVPAWLQPPCLPSGLETHTTWCKGALGASQTITVQGYTTGSSMLLGMKRVETRGFRLRPGWWNLHVGARETPEGVARVARAAGMPDVDDSAPRSAIIGRFLVVGALRSNDVPDCWALPAFGRYSSIIAETIMFATPFPCAGKRGAWQVIPALVPQMDAAMAQGTHRKVNVEDLAWLMWHSGAGFPANVSSKKCKVTCAGVSYRSNRRQNCGTACQPNASTGATGSSRLTSADHSMLSTVTSRAARDPECIGQHVVVPMLSMPTKRLQQTQPMGKRQRGHKDASHGLEGKPRIEAGEQDFGMARVPAGKRQKPEQHTLAGPAVSLFAADSSRDRAHTRVRQGNGTVVMQLVHVTRRVVRRRTFELSEHTWKSSVRTQVSDVADLCDNISTEAPDLMSLHVENRASLVTQVRACLRELRGQGLKIQSPTSENSAFASKLQMMRKSGHFCDLTLVSGSAHVQCHQCAIGWGSGPLAQLYRTTVQENRVDVKRNMEIQLAPVYHHQALLIVVEHIYGMDVRGLLQQAPLMCLVDVCRLGRAWDLLALVGVSAQSLGLLVGRLDIVSLKLILSHLPSMPSQGSTRKWLA